MGRGSATTRGAADPRRRRSGTARHAWPATARFESISGLALDGSENVLFADSWTGRVYRLTHGGELQVAAGGHSDEGEPALQAAFGAPETLAVSAAGEVYVGDSYSRQIRK